MRETWPSATACLVQILLLVLNVGHSRIVISSDHPDARSHGVSTQGTHVGKVTDVVMFVFNVLILSVFSEMTERQTRGQSQGWQS